MTFSIPNLDQLGAEVWDIICQFAPAGPKCFWFSVWHNKTIHRLCFHSFPPRGTSATKLLPPTKDGSSKRTGPNHTGLVKKLLVRTRTIDVDRVVVRFGCSWSSAYVMMMSSKVAVLVPVLYYTVQQISPSKCCSHKANFGMVWIERASSPLWNHISTATVIQGVIREVLCM